MERNLKVEIEEVKRLEKEALRIARDRDDLLRDIAEEFHPLTVGDVVQGNRVYAGLDMRVRVIGVVRDYNRSGYSWVARGPVFKKDGTEGRNTGEWRQPVEVEGGD